MELNKNSIQGKWTEIRGEILKAWGKLTSNELDQTTGDITSIIGLLQQKYGEKQEDYRQRVSDIFNKFEDKKEGFLNHVKDGLKSH